MSCFLFMQIFYKEKLLKFNLIFEKKNKEFFYKFQKTNFNYISHFDNII